MAETNEARDNRLRVVHERALRRFDAIQSAQRDERLQCVQDRRFCYIAGAQWEGPLQEQFANKPRFEVNKIHLAVIRILNEYLNNRVTVDFVPKDGRNDDKLADVCDGLYRADEQDSNANEAYDNAFEEAVAGGIGAFRLRACYEDDEDDDNERQRIKIEPIFDADTCVFFDLDAKRQDKADAKHGFVLTSMTPEAYKDAYDDDPASWPKDQVTTQFDWCTPDAVYLAEYYEVEEQEEIIHVYRGLDGMEMRVPDSELQEDERKAEELAVTGFKLVRQKKAKRTKVRKYILNGNRVLKDDGHIPGSCIPIVPVYGKRWFVDNVERCMGHVRLAKDAQRLKNMQLSRLGETSALSPIEKPIFTPEQVVGHQLMWADDNIKNYPYLLVNPMTDENGQQVAAGPIGYTKAPNIPPAMAALLQITEQDMQDLLGNQQAGEEVQPNISGKAIELIQSRLDMQSFIYMANFAKGMKRCGQIWLSMARDLYVEDGRKMKSVSENGDVGSVEIYRPAYDAESAETFMENDLTRAKFDVTAEVGPSSSSRRAATVRAVTGLLQMTQDPETQQVLTGMAMMNMEGEGIGDVRDFFRQRLLRMGAVKPTDEEAQQLAAEAQAAQGKPDPQAQYLQAEAEKAVAQGAKARADTVLTIAKAEETRASTAKILAEAGSEEQSQVLRAVEAVQSAQGVSSDQDAQG